MEPLGNEIIHTCDGGCDAPYFWQDHCFMYNTVVTMLETEDAVEHKAAVTEIATYYYPLVGVAAAKSRGLADTSDVCVAYMKLIPKYDLSREVPFKAFLNTLLTKRVSDVLRESYSRNDAKITKRIDALKLTPEFVGLSNARVEAYLVSSGEFTSRAIDAYHTRFNLKNSSPLVTEDGNQLDIGDAASDPADIGIAALETEQQERFAEALLALVSSQDREVIEARLYGPQAVADYAQQHGVSTQRIHLFANQAMSRLRKALAAEMNLETPSLRRLGLQAGVTIMEDLISSGAASSHESEWGNAPEAWMQYELFDMTAHI